MLNTLRESLLAHNIQPLIPQDFFLGNEGALEIQRQMAEADLVVGILPKGNQSPWVLFELGQAWALGRRILLIASPKSASVPYSLQRFLVIRAEADNREAIDFALDQLLSAPPELPTRESKRIFHTSGLGPVADSLIVRLDRALRSGSGQELESIISEAIRNSGTDVVVESPNRERGVDLAVWSDVLETFVGNPLLIETKLTIQDKKSAQTVFKLLTSYLGASDTKWMLLIYGEGPDPESTFWEGCPPNILIMRARTLLEALRTRAFAEIIRDLRNRRVHSVRP
ncbi:MAG TPA: hypothetical protein VNO32_61745 [Candidatus Acidoferrum sp.]|nr:hypothetical protein [Candidatus Acidoferrum sp.]